MRRPCLNGILEHNQRLMGGCRGVGDSLGVGAPGVGTAHAKAGGRTWHA